MKEQWVQSTHPGVGLLREARQVTLSTHWGADADGLGSALALRAGLQSLGISAKVILPNPLFDRVAFLDWNSEVLVWDQGNEASSWLSESDLVVLLDTSSLGSHELLGSAVENSDLPMMAIDHHLGESSSQSLVFPDAAATGEIVFETLRCLGAEVTPEMASWLFASISSDTCSFRFVRGRAETFRMGARLIDAGADPWKIQEGLYQSVSSDALRLFGRAEARRAFYADGRVAVVWFEPGALEDLTLDRDDHRDLIQNLIAQRNIRAAITVTERKDGPTKLSFRGRKGVNLEPMAREFGGGGHAQACGATLSIETHALKTALQEKLSNFDGMDAGPLS